MSVVGMNNRGRQLVEGSPPFGLRLKENHGNRMGITYLWHAMVMKATSEEVFARRGLLGGIGV